jgi:hypothetical protein
MCCLICATLGACAPGYAAPNAAPAAAPNAAPAAAPNAAPAAASKTEPNAEPKGCLDEGAPYDQKTLGANVAFLASPDLGGRVPGSDGDTTARGFIAGRMACLGLSPAGDDGGFQQAFVDPEQHTTANVVGFVKGSDAKLGDEIVLIGAHHDHIGGKLLGANDNASGVVALLAVAQWVKQHDAVSKRTIAFVTFSAEEQGMVGSQFFAANPPSALPMGKVVQYINLDMVGSHKSKGFVAAMGTFTKQPSRKLVDKLKASFPKLHVGVGGRAARSDHTAFCKLGIPYVFFWTPDEKCYHEACDTADKIDLPRMADIAALAGNLAWSLADSDSDLAASRKKLGCGQ